MTALELCPGVAEEDVDDVEEVGDAKCEKALERLNNSGQLGRDYF